MHPLDMPMEDNNADAKTIGEYLVTTLRTLWREGEGFSGKRPLGDSDWEGPVIIALIKGGAIEGSLDEDGYLDDYPDDIDEYMDTVIESLYTRP